MKEGIIWSIVIILILGAVGAVVWLAKSSNSETNTTGGTQLSVPVSEKDTMRGPKDAKVVLVEYSDFQCPACRSFYPQIEEISKELEGKILFVYRHFPLPQHKQALAAAYASEAAKKQGKFFEMYQKIFDGQSEWAEKDGAEKIFEKYATELGLDMISYAKDVESSETKDKVESEKLSGYSSGVNSTPTFFLNGEKMEGYKSYDDFKNILRRAAETGA